MLNERAGKYTVPYVPKCGSMQDVPEACRTAFGTWDFAYLANCGPRRLEEAGAGKGPRMSGVLRHSEKVICSNIARNGHERMNRGRHRPPNKIHRKQKLKSQKKASGLQEFFSEQFGERWPGLFEALAEPTQHVALLNSFCKEEWGPGDGADMQVIDVGPTKCLRFSNTNLTYPPPGCDPHTGLTTHYWLDFASLMPPICLNVQQGARVLDMCAAPGGKSFILAQLVFGGRNSEDLNGTSNGSAQNALSECEANDNVPKEEIECKQNPTSDALHEAVHSDSNTNQQTESQGVSGGHFKLVCNEPDSKRRSRLHRVLDTYLPETLRSSVRVTPFDGTRWWRGYESESYDFVLVDAHCTSERHVMQNAVKKRNQEVPKDEWSVSQCKRAAETQFKLVRSGLKALKVGGRLAYSTCSITDGENDEVVGKLLKKFPESVRAVSHEDFGGGHTCPSALQLEAWGAERTEHGWMMLPDVQHSGPIYWVVFEKIGQL